MMSFVVQHPHSRTNPTDKYRVCDSGDWTAFVNGATTSYAFTPFDTYEQAQKARNEANRELETRRLASHPEREPFDEGA
jgi:hypothetical protein